MPRSVTPVKAKSTPVDVSSASIGIATPAFGALAGSAGKVAEQIACAIARGHGYVRVLGNPPCHGYADFTPLGDERIVSTVLSLLSPTYWLRTAERRTVGIITSAAGFAPPEWELGLRQATRVVCPSVWSKSVVDPLVRSVSVVPFGIDATFCQPLLRKRRDTLRIVHFAGDLLDWRKGLDLTLAAFAEAFADREDVELILHSTTPREIEKTDARIRVSVGPVTPPKLLELYHSCDVMLYPSRAESFPMVALEAMATGLPVIHSGATGMADCASFGLTATSRPIPSEIAGPRVWCEPLVESLVEQLREVDSNYAAVSGRAFSQASEVAQWFSWDKTAQSLLRIAQG